MIRRISAEDARIISEHNQKLDSIYRNIKEQSELGNFFFRIKSLTKEEAEEFVRAGYTIKVYHDRECKCGKCTHYHSEYDFDYTEIVWRR